jgi:hypothetical protein
MGGCLGNHGGRMFTLAAHSLRQQRTLCFQLVLAPGALPSPIATRRARTFVAITRRLRPGRADSLLWRPPPSAASPDDRAPVGCCGLLGQHFPYPAANPLRQPQACVMPQHPASHRWTWLHEPERVRRHSAVVAADGIDDEIGKAAVERVDSFPKI